MSEEAVLTEETEDGLEGFVEEKFEYDAEFQSKIAALALRDDDFLRKTSHILNPEFFENEGEARLVSMSLAHFAKYNCAPDPVSIAQVIKDQAHAKILKGTALKAVVDSRKVLYSTAVHDRLFVEEKIVDFARKQAMSHAILNSVPHLERGEYEKIEGLVKEALAVGVNEDGCGYDYYEAARNRQAIRIDKKLGKTPKTGITSGCRELDNLLYHHGWGRKEMLLLMGGPKSGKCVTRDTMIFTNDGLIEIGDIVPLDLGVDQFKDHVMPILGMNGMEATSHVYNSGLTPTIQVKTRRGFSIEGTHHHPMLVMSETGQHEWRQLDELQIGDFIVGQQGEQVYANKIDLSYAAEGTSYPTTMTPELAEWLAMAIAEGYLGQKGQVEFTQKDPVILQRFITLTASLFGLSAKVHSQPNKTDRAIVQSLSLKAYLEKLGVVCAVSKHKVVPHAVLSAPKSSVLAFVSALIGLEGNVRKIGNKVIFDLCMASKKLIKQIHMLLLNEGVIAAYSEKTSCATNGLKIMRDYYRLQVSGRRNIEALKLIGLYESRKNDVLDSYDCEDTTAREWLPHQRELIGRVMKEFQNSGYPLKSTFDPVFYRQLRKIRGGVDGEVRHLTVALAQKILTYADRFKLCGSAVEQLRALVSGRYYYEEVKTLQHATAVTVDVTVPDTHSFFANGLVSHNTQALINFGRAATLAKFNVLYVTLEVSADIISDRMDAAISKTNMRDLGDKAIHVADAVDIAKASAGKFIIHEYGSGTFSPNQLRKLVERYQNPGRNADGTMRPPIKFDMIVVDYADLMRPDHRMNDDIANSKSVYTDLRAIAHDFNVALITATQTNREGHKSTVAKMDHVAEDFNKIRIADLVISINKTEEEAARGEARLYFAASRNQETGFTVVIKQNVAMMRFLEEIIRVE